MLDLKEYNVIQCNLFTEYCITDLVLNDIIEFRKICSMVSIIRNFDSVIEAEKVARDIIEKELNAYNN